MKKYFKKSLAVLLVVASLISIMSVSAFAAVYMVTFSIDSNTDEGCESIDMATDENGKLLIPKEEDFTAITRKGYYIYGWSTRANASSRTYQPGKSYTFKKATVIYPVWRAYKYTCNFVAGDGASVSGDTSFSNLTYGNKITPPEATNPPLVLVGWTTVEGGTTPEFNAGDPITVTGDATYYGVWLAPKYEIGVDKTSFKIAQNCIGTDVASGTFDIVNSGNQTITIDPIASENYDFSYSDSSMKIEMGRSLTVTVTPKRNLPIGNYDETFNIIGSDGTSASTKVSYNVVDHAFEVYVSQNDATYTQDGTKVAACLNGCGTEDVQEDIGSMKVYSPDNNTVTGLLSEYTHHKTVRFTAYGSGSDDYNLEIEGFKRYTPVSWYVNDEFNGKFEDGNYSVVYVHQDFGDFVLQVKYVEQQIAFDENGDPVIDAETGMPVYKNCVDADGNVIEDTKTFNYRIGPSEKDEVEVVRPNMIVNIIFGLFGYLIETIKTLFG